MKRRLQFTLDVMTDGSLHTGDGTLFLSVWKKPNYTSEANTSNWIVENMKTNPPLARYAISGLGDGTARLSADQRFKLAPTRAAFLPNPESWDGLSALLLAIFTAGSPSLHVVSDNSERMEQLAQLVLGRHKDLSIPTCQVPISDADDDESSKSSWWKVYDDEFLIAHAQVSDSKKRKLSFIYSLLENGDPVMNLLIVPPDCRNNAHGNLEKELDLDRSSLPVIQGDSPLKIDLVIMLNPNPGNVPIIKGDIPVLFTAPAKSGDCDPGLFVKSRKVATHLHSSLPWIFRGDISPTTTGEASTIGENSINRLRSCTSILLATSDDDSPAIRYQVIDRRSDILDRDIATEDWATTIESMEELCPKPEKIEVDDENEIDLEEEDGEDSEPSNPDAMKEPHLLVLGTGCASPSAIRGACGNAIIFPSQNPQQSSMDILLVDCGEAVASMFERYADGSIQLSDISTIWISHAHLDHYGGIPTLMRILQKQFEVEQSRNQHVTKRLRREYRPPRIVAPSKVLRYLDIVLRCRQGVPQGSTLSTSNNHRPLFLPRTQEDPTFLEGPWSWFQNIKVFHSCCPSYGLLVGYDVVLPGGRRTTRFLCVSGDTRPCGALVRACRHAMASRYSSELFLLHEATFQEEEQASAEKKKHSTIKEAIQVGYDIPASRILLTHFSQRYVSLNHKTSATEDKSSLSSNQLSIPVGLAMDGCYVKL